MRRTAMGSRTISYSRPRAAVKIVERRSPVREVEPIPLELRWSNGTLQLVGEIDLSNASLLVGEAPSVIARGGVVVLDFSGVTFLDATGAEAVLRLADEVRPHGCHLLLRDLTPQVRRLLHILELSRLGVDIA